MYAAHTSKEGRCVAAPLFFIRFRPVVTCAVSTGTAADFTQHGERRR